MPPLHRTHLDLFSGIGGFAIAAQACGYTTIGFCEKEPYAQQILKERFGAVLADADSGGYIHGKSKVEPAEGSHSSFSESIASIDASSFRPKLHPDIFTLNGADYAGVDLLTGGFPCQPFSVAGKRRGAADDRAIWPQMLRVIDGAKPRWLIGENVAGIVTMELDNILSDLESLGYSAWPLVIPACAVDARHRRDRVWIIGRRNVGNAKHDGHPAAKIRGGIAPGSNGDKTGQKQASKPARPSEQHEDVAYADKERESRLPKRTKTQYASIGISGQNANVADADEPSRQGNQRTERSQPERADHQQHRGRQLESAVCGMADGLPERLDGGGEFCEWPEEDLQTPRVSTGIKHRAHRLRGLGNAIVPQVAEQIIRSIALADCTLIGV